MRAAIVLSLAALAFAVPVAGQTLKPEAQTGSRIPVPPDAFPIDKTRDVFAAFAQCAVKKFPELTHEMVLDASKVAVDKKYRKAADPDCLVQAVNASYSVVQLQMSPTSFRAAVADELVRRDLGGFDPAEIKLAEPLQHPTIDPADYVPKRSVSPETLANWQHAKERDTGEAWLSTVGDCAVRANPSGARELLQTKVNSDEELHALLALIPAFSSCIDQGHKVQTVRASLRGAVAVNYYRLAYAPKVPRPEAAK